MYQWNGKPRRNGYILRKVQPSRTKKKQKRWTDHSQILKLKLWLKNSQQAKVQDQVASQMNSFNIYRISLVQSLRCVQVFATPCRRPCPSPTLRACSNSCPSCWWCHPACSSSVIPLSSCLQSFPASGSFQISQLFASGGQSTGVSASGSVLPMNMQDWCPLQLTGLISLQSKGPSRVFSNTTVQKQFFSIQLSL